MAYNSVKDTVHALWILQLLLLADTPALRLSRAEVELPAARGTVGLDYLAADRASGQVWIPAGQTGLVDVLDVATRTVGTVAGFAAAAPDQTRDPSAVSLGEEVAFIGDRGTSQLCTVDKKQLAKLGCVSLAARPDGVQYVATTREVRITTPRDRSVTVVDARSPSRPKLAGRIVLPGSPEGYAVDDARGRFFTNLEDKNQTVALDVRARRVVDTWKLPCGERGPRGLALDRPRQFLFVACTDKILVLDSAHRGRLLSMLQTGAGVDNIDYLERTGNLYVAAGRAERLTVIHVDAKGALSVLATAPTAQGARVVVVAGDGTAIVGDPHHGRVLMFSAVANAGAESP